MNMTLKSQIQRALQAPCGLDLARFITFKPKLQAERQIKFPTIGTDARALGVSRQHLWEVLVGNRTSRSLMGRYATLKRDRN